MQEPGDAISGSGFALRARSGAGAPFSWKNGGKRLLFLGKTRERNCWWLLSLGKSVKQELGAPFPQKNGGKAAPFPWKSKENMVVGSSFSLEMQGQGLFQGKTRGKQLLGASHPGKAGEKQPLEAPPPWKNGC